MAARVAYGLASREVGASVLVGRVSAISTHRSSLGAIVAITVRGQRAVHATSAALSQRCCRLRRTIAPIRGRSLPSKERSVKSRKAAFKAHQTPKMRGNRLVSRYNV